MVTQAFKEKWMEKLTSGKAKRNRYGLDLGEGEQCVMAVARSVAEEMDMIPKKNVTGQYYLDEEDLRIIGINKDTQYHLASLNDIYIAKDGAFPRRVLNAIAALPVTIPITVYKKEPVLLTYDK